MKSFCSKKSCIFISASAAILLNISKEEKEPIISCLLVLMVLAVLIAKSKDEIFTKPICFSNNAYLVTALLICSAMGCNFYSRCVKSGIIDKISEFLGISDKHMALFLSVLGVLAAIPVTAILIADFSKIVVEAFKRSPILLDDEKQGISAQKSFGLMAVIFFVGISAILRANFNYIDDMGRVAQGYRGWENFSRFVSNALSTMIHMDNYITDISPLTQLIAVLILALAGIILLYVVYERRAFSVWELIALIPLGLNPYFLECISYKFDAPFMALSILAAIAPLLLRESSVWKYILAVIIGNILVCSSYQAASGIFPMVVILISLRMWFKNKPLKEIFRFILNSVVGFGIALAFFRQVIMIPTDTYVSNVLPSMGELLPMIVTNFIKYFNLILTDYEVFWKWIMVLLMLAFSLSGLKLSKQRKLLTFALTVVAGIMMFFLCFGLYPALTAPLFEPRAMYGFGVFITLLCISTAENFQWTVMKMPAITVAWIFFVFAFTYGNALFVQKSYTDFRITQVISDLNDMEAFLGDEVVTVQIAGNIGYSPIVERMSADCNILSRLVPVTFRESWDWGLFGFYNYYGLKNVKRDSSVDLTSYDLPVIKDGMYHTIYGEGNYVLVKLK